MEIVKGYNLISASGVHASNYGIRKQELLLRHLWKESKNYQNYIHKD